MGWIKWRVINGLIHCRNVYVTINNAVLTATSSRIGDWVRVRHIVYNVRKCVEQRSLRRYVRGGVRMSSYFWLRFTLRLLGFNICAGVWINGYVFCPGWDGKQEPIRNWYSVWVGCMDRNSGMFPRCDTAWEYESFKAEMQGAKGE